MNEFAWIAPLKEAVLLLFFLVFSGVLLYAFRMPGLDELAQIPFRDEETA
ncbi:MAG: cbb3-type cytochrome c oxidase subunit 3 [Candidatus Eremiobacteraeota bacterium]|nr:cbb3-type cytochrome c oxidase subunit 3 [Candidatus Eremiobacteraeota bacterium]